MSDTNTPPAMEKPTRRWLGPAFLVSLALNLFLVALISAPLFMGPRHGDFGPPPRGHGPTLMHGAFKELPEADREMIRRTMKEQFRQVIPHIREANEARDALADAIAAEPYDEAAVRAAFDDMSKAMTTMSDMGRDAMLDAFSRLTPEQRHRVADAMRKDRERMKVLWRKHRDDRRDGFMEGMPDDDMPSDMPPPPMD